MNLSYPTSPQDAANTLAELLAQLPHILPPAYQAQLTAALQLHTASMAHLIRTCLAARQALSASSTISPASTVPAAPIQARHPAPPNPTELATWLASYQARYAFPLGRLLQILPEEIINQPRLTTEQGQMCHAVAQLAAQATATLRQGAAQVQAMLTAEVTRTEAVVAQQVQDFLDYCQREAAFWQECQIDYDDAASNLAWVTE